MKGTKRILSLLLILIMTLSIFTGCGNKKTSKGEGGKLTVGIPQDMGVLDYETNSFTLWLEEQTGVEIEYVFYASSGADYMQQLALDASAGEEFPDVLVGFNSMSHYQANQYGEDGYFIDLAELIEKHAPNYQKALEGLDKEMRDYIKEKGVSTVDGKSIYAMPSLEMEYADNLQSLIYINQEWLNQLGLSVPTNVAELEAVCDAFLTQDPNGNGEPDEIPMLGKDFIPWLLNAYVEYDNDTFNIDANGKVWDPLTTDEFRQGMAWINSLVSKGYYSTLSFSTPAPEVQGLISESDGVAKIGMFVGHHENMILSGADEVMKKFTAVGALADASGKGGYTIVREIEPKWGAAITTDCENPELAMKFLDIFYTDEAITRQRWGEKDTDWEYKEGTTVQGTESYVHPLNPTAYIDKSQNTTVGNLLYIMKDWNYLSIVDESETDGRNYEVNRLQKEQWDVMKKAKDRTVVGNLVYTTEEYEIREEKANSIGTYIQEQLRVLSTGENGKNILDDAVWSKFQSELKSQGREDLLKVAQDACDRKFK